MNVASVNRFRIGVASVAIDAAELYRRLGVHAFYVAMANFAPVALAFDVSI
jgi:hypothetical protein